jgi:hypothetical protein
MQRAPYLVLLMLVLMFIEVPRWIFDAACPVCGAVNVGV